MRTKRASGYKRTKKVKSKRTYKPKGKRRKNPKSKRRKNPKSKRRVTPKGSSGTVWEITEQDAKRLIKHETTVQETDDDFHDLKTELMGLRLDEPIIEYKTHAIIMQEELDHLGTEEAYIERLRIASEEAEEDAEEYTDEYRAEDIARYNSERTRAINRANTYRNDLHNYARALLNRWRERGEYGSIL
jgi:hypothetical protein